MCQKNGMFATAGLRDICMPSTISSFSLQFLFGTWHDRVVCWYIGIERKCFHFFFLKKYKRKMCIPFFVVITLVLLMMMENMQNAWIGLCVSSYVTLILNAASSSGTSTKGKFIIITIIHYCVATALQVRLFTTW